MKNFKEIAEEYYEEPILWSREELESIIRDVDDEDVSFITNIILDVLEYDDTLEEKMSAQAKKKDKIKRNKPAFKNAMRKRARCKEKNKVKIAASKDKNVPYICGTDGKLKKGMELKSRKLLRKSRKRLKNKITL